MIKMDISRPLPVTTFALVSAVTRHPPSVQENILTLKITKDQLQNERIIYTQK